MTSRRHNFSHGSLPTVPPDERDPLLPTMIVFDLDDCLWTPEMHELPGPPSVPHEGPLDPDNTTSGETGVVGLGVPRGPVVRLFDGARRVLRRLALEEEFRGVVLAAASSSLEPLYSRACLDRLEILPGLPLRDMMSYARIGRTGPLSPRKTTHFALLQRESGMIPYDEMLFFDDCHWGDHVGDVGTALGVVGQRTPRGLRLDEFEQGLATYRRVALQRAAET